MKEGIDSDNPLTPSQMNVTVMHATVASRGKPKPHRQKQLLMDKGETVESMRISRNGIAD